MIENRSSSTTCPVFRDHLTYLVNQVLQCLQMGHLIGYLVKSPRAAVLLAQSISGQSTQNSAKDERTVTHLESEIADNDMLRLSFEGGCVEISDDVASSYGIKSIIDGVRNYDSFAEHKNEQDDHAFGLIKFDEGWIFWEISKCEKFEPRTCKCSLKKVLKIYFDYEMQL